MSRFSIPLFRIWHPVAACALFVSTEEVRAQDHPSPEAIVTPWLSAIPETPYQLDDWFPRPEDLPDRLGDDDWHWLTSEASPTQRFTGLMHLLVPKAGAYPSLSALKDLINQARPEWQFSREQISQLNQAMLAYVAFHRDSKVAPESATRLRAHLEGFSREMHLYLLEGARNLPPELATRSDQVPKPNALVVQRFWRKADPGAVDVYEERRGERAADKDLLAWADTLPDSKSKGLWELDLNSGKIRTEPIPGFDTDDSTKFFAQLDRRLVISGHQGFSRMDPKDTWRTFELPEYALYLQVVPWRTGALCLWTAPPHYFGAVEQERDKEKAEEMLKSLEPEFNIWNGHDAQITAIPKSDSMHFLDNSEIKLNPTLVTAGGRLVLGVRQRIPEDPAAPVKIAVHVSAPDDASRYEHWADVPGNWEFCTWPGAPKDEVLVLVNRPGDFTSRWDEEPQPERVLSCNLITRKSQLLWSLDPTRTVRHPWTVKEIEEPKEPRWKLPEGYDPPQPGIVHEWLRTFGHAGRLYALCSRIEVGRQALPDYELLVFAPDQPTAKRVPLHFVLPSGLRVDGLDPLPVPTDNYLAFDTRCGIYWVSWQDIAVATKY
ncbi:hypothetical protein [Verrucomicrobium sp. BvORR034]|uniref:hypothetical protein n=1 Tax=Verrucomicrobium sp. BvORR034 TaxID=1396418 RepID=UPI0006794691|nr:hypothetical protein [Verrucomicrobium sp. BvORR034]